MKVMMRIPANTRLIRNSDASINTGGVGIIDEDDNLTGSREQANTQGTGNEINRNSDRQKNRNAN